MASFVYTARARSGLVQSGDLDAVNEDEVLAVLQGRGLIVTSLARKEAKAAPTLIQGRRARLHGRATTGDKVLFCQQMATLIEAGIPLLKSLEVLSAQVESRLLLAAIERMRQDIEAGLTFHDALARHPRVFSSFWVNIVQTGEASGHLAQSLQQLARYLESVRDLQGKAMTALTYPIVLMVMAVGALTVFMVFIIPKFTSVFASMNLTLPLLTQLVIAASTFTRTYWWLGLLGLAAAGYGLGRFLRTEEGRWLRDRLLLKLPVFHRLFTHLQLSQFARGLGTLLESGVPILFSLEIMEHSATNRVYGRAIGRVKEFVREGKPMAEPMARTELFPPMVVQMVQVGEEIGELSKMLDRIARFYEERLRTFIERMTSLFEPFAIFVMAMIIGTIVVSMFLPIFSLAGGFNPQ